MNTAEREQPANERERSGLRGAIGLPFPRKTRQGCPTAHVRTQVVCHPCFPHCSLLRSTFIILAQVSVLRASGTTRLSAAGCQSHTSLTLPRVLAGCDGRGTASAVPPPCACCRQVAGNTSPAALLRAGSVQRPDSCTQVRVRVSRTQPGQLAQSAAGTTSVEVAAHWQVT